jgi:hypothetical protein
MLSIPEKKKFKFQSKLNIMLFFIVSKIKINCVFRIIYFLSIPLLRTLLSGVICCVTQNPFVCNKVCTKMHCDFVLRSKKIGM